MQGRNRTQTGVRGNDPSQSSRPPATILRWGGMTKINALPRPSAPPSCPSSRSPCLPRLAGFEPRGAARRNRRSAARRFATRRRTFPKTTVGNQSPGQEFSRQQRRRRTVRGSKRSRIEGPDASDFMLDELGLQRHDRSPVADAARSRINFKPGSLGAKQATAVIVFNSRPDRVFRTHRHRRGARIRLRRQAPMTSACSQPANPRPPASSSTNTGEAGVQFGNFEIAGPASPTPSGPATATAGVAG